MRYFLYFWVDIKTRDTYNTIIVKADQTKQRYWPLNVGSIGGQLIFCLKILTQKPLTRRFFCASIQRKTLLDYHISHFDFYWVFRE